MTPNITPAELTGLAQDLAETYERKVKGYRLCRQVREAQCEQLVAEELQDKSQIEVLEASSPDQVTWAMLLPAVEHDEERAMAVWKKIRREAQRRLESGHSAAQAAHFREPFQKAQFYAVRESFIDEWQPRGGVEMRLIDMMAQAYAGWMYWQDLMYLRTLNGARKEKLGVERCGEWKPPRIEEAEARDQAVKFADRFHKMFMRSLRALRDLRRYTPNITIQNRGGQVNIASNQQVNS